MAVGESSRDDSGRQRLQLGLAVFCFVLALGTAPCPTAAAISISAEEMQRIREYVQSKHLPAPAVTTVQTKYDGPVDCVRLEDQPSMQHPSMKGHKIQLAPSVVRKRLASSKPPPGLDSGVSCPTGTVPIQRLTESRVAAHGSLDAYLLHQSRRGSVPPQHGSPNTGSRRKFMETDIADTAASAPTAAVGPRFEYAVATQTGPTYAVNSSVQLWRPYVEAVSNASASRAVLYVDAGSGSTYNQIMAGFEVDPLHYGSTDPVIFISWTSDGFNSTGCFNFDCLGFVQVDSRQYFGQTIALWSDPTNLTVSYYQYIILSFDAAQNNWWYYWAGNYVGYFPGTLFSLLNNRPATSASVGGIVWNDYPQGRHSKTQMGSARFPYDPAVAKHWRVLVASNSSLVEDPFVSTSLTITDPNCYNAEYRANDSNFPGPGGAVYYGGPGYDPVRCPGPKAQPPPPTRHAPPPPPYRGGPRATGLIPPNTISPFKKLNPYFRYASYRYTGSAASLNWDVTAYIDWRDNGDVLTQVKNQGTCGACWAFAAVAAIESAYMINHAVAVSGSEQQVIDCQGSDSCVGGWPGDALDYVANNTASGSGGLASGADYPFTGSNHHGCLIGHGVAGAIGVQMWEQVDFYGWFGLLLAVQNQPVIVNIEADQASFLNYGGGYIYTDANCFKNGLVDHSVLLVGYYLASTTPYWIIRNSWGPGWGEGGYMRLAISGGNGICGITSTPGFYPVLEASSPCKGKINPCGGGRCVVKGSTNLCKCPPAFVAVTNKDGTQSCAPAQVCVFFLLNPCNQGTCVSNGAGGYSCICRPGFTQGYRADGSLTCVPGVLVQSTQTYIVQRGDTCYLIYTAFGLTATQFLAQNPKLKCQSPLKAGTVVKVTPPKAAPGCSLTYAISKTDTCAGVERLFGLTSASFLKLNPGLVCTGLGSHAGQQVCVQAGNLTLPLCRQYHEVEGGDTCALIERHYLLTPRELYSYNPGLNCNNLLPKGGTEGSYPGQSVCISVAPQGRVQCPRAKYTVRRGDTCASIVFHRFNRSYAKFRKLNRQLECKSNSLWVGEVICTS